MMIGVIDHIYLTLDVDQIYDNDFKESLHLRYYAELVDDSSELETDISQIQSGGVHQGLLGRRPELDLKKGRRPHRTRL